MKRNPRKQTLLSAARNNDIETVRLLLEHGADANGEEFSEETPIHEAVKCGNIDLVRPLLDHGADVDARNACDETPLHAAAWSRNLKMVKLLLLEAGADPSNRDHGDLTAFDVSCINQHEKDGDDGGIADFLFQYGQENPVAWESERYYSIHKACELHHVATVRFLIDRGVDLTARDNRGLTAIERLDTRHGGNQKTREQILDLFREHAPELFMEVYCMGSGTRAVGM